MVDQYAPTLLPSKDVVQVDARRCYFKEGAGDFFRQADRWLNFSCSGAGYTVEKSALYRCAI